MIIIKYLKAHIFLAFTVCICAVASQTYNGLQQNTFSVLRASNGTELCCVDPPSKVFNVSQLDGSLVSVGCAPLIVLCAWKCTNDLDCSSYNWKDDVELCELYYYPTTSCAIVNGCTFYQVGTL